MQPRRRTVKPFIDRKTAESFYVVHRSQQDPAYHDEAASRMVLMSTRVARLRTEIPNAVYQAFVD